MNINSTKDYKYILGQRVDYTTYHNAVDKIIKYSNKEKSSYICASNVHMVMESHDNNNFQNIINNKINSSNFELNLIFQVKFTIIILYNFKYNLWFFKR